jgi:hypothetical protein
MSMGSGCGENCTELGCGPSQIIRFDQVLSGPGEYAVALTTSGSELVLCTATLPLQEKARCSVGLVNWIVKDGDSEDVYGNLVGPAVVLAGVSVADESTTTSLRLTHGGNELYSGTLTLNYEDEFLNGKNCEPCRRASQTAPLGAISYRQEPSDR